LAPPLRFCFSNVLSPSTEFTSFLQTTYPQHSIQLISTLLSARSGAARQVFSMARSPPWLPMAWLLAFLNFSQIALSGPVPTPARGYVAQDTLPQITAAPALRFAPDLVKRQNVLTGGAWVSLGCWTGTNGVVRYLSTSLGNVGLGSMASLDTFIPASNQPAYCTPRCERFFYTQCAMENGNECWGGNSFQFSGMSLSSGCTATCPGAPATSCGGAGVQNLYTYSGTITFLATATGWQVMGCYTQSGLATAPTTFLVAGGTSSVASASETMGFAQCGSYARALAASVGSTYDYIELFRPSICVVGRSIYTADPIRASPIHTYLCSASCLNNPGEYCGGTAGRDLGLVYTYVSALSTSSSSPSSVSGK